jgi:hypothetical protein
MRTDKRMDSNFKNIVTDVLEKEFSEKMQE